MGKCKFNENWLSNREFSSWLKAVPGNVYEARCILCKKCFKLGTMGVKAVESHMQSAKHKASKSSCQQTLGISRFCSTLVSTGPPPPAPISATGTAAPHLRTVFGCTPTLKAEVLWCLNTVTKHQSYKSNEGAGDLFRAMFPDSDIARSFACGSDKTAYISKFGLARYISEQLVADVNKDAFVLMFDESLNHTTKTKQLDLHIRYWCEDHVQSRYSGSQFMGHGTAEDLLRHFKEGAKDLDRRKLLSVSMDGPNVNWKFLELLQQEQAEQYGGAQLIVVGTCGLHTLHNACKGGFVMWQLDKVLRAMHVLFHNTPARREDFMVLTKTTQFPLPFCGHRWLENLPVVERALELWPSVTMYMDAVRTKRLPNPGTSSFDTLEAAQKDPLIMPKLHFYLAVIRTFSPFLTTYQTDQPMMPFLVNDLAELMKCILRRFIKRDVLQDISPLQLARLDVGDKKNWLHPKEVNIGLGAESTLKVT
ncbi:uncharacterized protein LOC127535448 isoform X2 [Acanthochromis polyacanthus]|uniref:uncharacterized protein LOC110970170 isoform X2 n=1 Tax=Acanthochromis polyacanthus TaxID=80966 RepID=UPI002234D919|nr:uncharacterized protein LOC110970170 isoform X2 [Acanthochromis polyacanthus]XP_051809501.1 uncharacterized protein LOC127535448 isoform X2 [Acanthochromis polyacanthus]